MPLIYLLNQKKEKLNTSTLKITLKLGLRINEKE